jgi:hypothetical protein
MTNLLKKSIFKNNRRNNIHSVDDEDHAMHMKMFEFKIDLLVSPEEREFKDR